MDLPTRNCLVQFRTKMGLRAGPCQMKACRNLISKFEGTGVVTDLPRARRPRISDVQVAEIFRDIHPC